MTDSTQEMMTPMIELRREDKTKTKILVRWIEPLDKGKKARVRLLIEEEFEVDESYESVRKSVCGQSPTLKLV